MDTTSHSIPTTYWGFDVCYPSPIPLDPPKLILMVHRPWDLSSWETTDDTVRGGNSSSHLSISSDLNIATFSGYLDAQALSGAGFASQRTIGSLDWDLSAYSGLLISVTETDDKNYTITLKDTLPANSSESSLLYEIDYRGAGEKKFAWGDFVPTLRGRVQNGTVLNTTRVLQVSLMVRSYFGAQEGSFSMSIESISAYE